MRRGGEEERRKGEEERRRGEGEESGEGVNVEWRRGT